MIPVVMNGECLTLLGRRRSASIRCKNVMRLSLWLVSMIGRRQIALMVGVGVCGSVLAGPFDSVHPYFVLSESYDANLLGLPNSAAGVATTGSPNMGDFSHVEQGGFSIDDLIGQQHFTGDISEAKTDFDRFNELDHQDANLQGNLNWHLGSHLFGDIGASYAQSLTPFIDFHLLQLNLRQQRQESVDATWQFHPSWQAWVNSTGYQLTYSLDSELPDDRNEYRTAAGVDYLDSNGSTTGIEIGHTRGYFPFPEIFGNESIINNYNQGEVKAKLNWQFSGKMRLQFLGGWVDRTHDFLASRDYSGLNERLVVDWATTGKTSFNLTAWHEIGAVDNLTTVYSINHGISVSPAWVLSSKLRWDLMAKIEKRDYAQSLTVTDSPTPGLTELERNASIMLTYAPTLHWQIQASAYYIAQATNTDISNFSGSGIMCSSKYQF
jgi:exopolysaccharide biosynthesis operon protein EpsL